MVTQLMHGGRGGEEQCSFRTRTVPEPVNQLEGRGGQEQCLYCTHAGTKRVLSGAPPAARVCIVCNVYCTACSEGMNCLRCIQYLLLRGQLLL
jgi:hypothetical protein